MNTTEIINNDKVARIKAIEYEVDTTPRPKLGVNSIEDCDELYQAKLEYGWWKDELQEEYDTLRADLGLGKLAL